MGQYELIQDIQEIQACIWREIPYIFNIQALYSLSLAETLSLDNAVDIVINQEDSTQEEASSALAYIANFSRKALELEHEYELTYIYLKENLIECGVDNKGEIVLWDPLDKSGSSV